MVKIEALQILQAMTPAQKLRAAERLYHSAWQLKAAALRAEHPDSLGVAYMVSGSVAVIIYGEPRLTHDVDLIVVLDREQIARARHISARRVLLSASRGDCGGGGARTTRTLQHYSS